LGNCKKVLGKGRSLGILLTREVGYIEAGTYQKKVAIRGGFPTKPQLGRKDLTAGEIYMNPCEKKGQCID